MLIDITMMRGEIPRLKDHLLPNEAASFATDTHFENGVLAPLAASQSLATLPMSAGSFHRYSDGWLAWDSRAISVIESPVAQDPFQRVYYTGDGSPKVTAQDIALNGEGVGPSASYELGVPRPDSPPVVTSVDGSTGEEPPEGESPSYDDEDRVYIQTYVTRFGEESAPGEPSLSVLVERPGSTVTVKLTRPLTNRNNITHTRLYRSATSTESSDYVLVAEVPISHPHFADSARNVNGPVMETWGYEPPPANMQGLCQMANGICAGFAGNEVMFSEAYLPYAWPSSYRSTTEHEIVGIAAIGTSLVVVTKGYPYLFEGITPDAIAGHKLNVEQSCVSAESLVVLKGTAVYASPDGLVVVSSEGANLLTENIIDRNSWQTMAPDSLCAVAVEGEYIAQGSAGGFIYDPVSESLTRVTETWEAAYVSLERDVMVIAKGRQLSEWKSADGVRSFVWRSKEFWTPMQAMLNCARIQSHDPEHLSVRVIANGVTVHVVEKGALTGEAFRLPAVRANRWQIEITGSAEVERIMMASSMEELA
ncbi:hypothetical protein K6Q96_06945 [Grimontia kaedaensis]|uniref:Uncharacterized protein n=1 Tax=Grimontia kaedaensis TaxID=2872157 RepID=A0ABY4WXJ7_9GAMM|nr:hypothetical protein [Grimontia kaedaensis]USH03724.1 hypothetical protein K6Q96_06945 [Grimontia kaedaensis]